MALDLVSIEKLIATRLPASARWPFEDWGDEEFNFFPKGMPGNRYLPTAWFYKEFQVSDYFVFGDLDFADGGGACYWLCIDKQDESICAFDVSLDQGRMTFNSSLAQFVQSFHVLDRYLCKGEQPPQDCEAQLRAIDPVYSDSRWKMFLDIPKRDDLVGE